MTYRKLSSRQHVLERPDTYGGSVNPVTWENIVVDTDFEDVEVIPMLYKIFDEIIVNAMDNISTGKTSEIHVEIRRDGAFRVINNGKCVPIAKHKETKLWIPELVFGHLRTSSNYDDTESRLTGGRNGYGAKLTNIFSSEFAVSIIDHKKSKKYSQTWSKNMGIVGKADIVPCTSSESWTEITSTIDLSRFGCTEIPEDTYHLMCRRVHDILRNYPGIKVRFNSCSLEPKTTPYMFKQSNKRWNFTLGISDGQFRQLSFVNGIWTRKGGTHVRYILGQILLILEPLLKKLKITKYDIQRYLQINLSCHLVNPTFDSQMKEECTLPSKDFGSEFKVQKTLMSAVKSSGLYEILESIGKRKDDRKLSRKDGKKRRSVDVDKLTDALNAGTGKSKGCTLILTEGDSANALAKSGISVVGSKNYGSYPLKGKILNGYTASTDKWAKNAVITDVIKCMGLKHGKKYTDTSELRYGSILVMADQDTDGFHIRGLVFALFGSHWKELLEIPGFIKVMKTPLVKAFRGKQMVKEFFNEDLAMKYINENPEFRYKFYKGLGTSTSAEAKEMFKNLDRYTFCMTGDSTVLKKAFDNEHRDFRKDIVTRPASCEDRDGKSYGTYLSGPWVEHARATNERSIPDGIDGFKPVQRKTIYTMITRNNTEIKVAQANGQIALNTHFHHGETNVGNNIVNQSQDFVGSNNINLLVPLGQFGTRHMGGGDHASHRYIFIKLSAVVKLLFRPEDLSVLDYNVVDGHTVEPHHFVPIIPFVLVNGASGIGTGWATDIPKFNPIDIINVVLGEKDINTMVPYYRGFKGRVLKRGDQWVTCGNYQCNGNTLIITELPIGVWTNNFKDRLRKQKYETFSEEHTDTTVKFNITCQTEADVATLVTKLGLEQPIKENWCVYESDILKRTDLNSIFESHRSARLEMYCKRKQHDLNQIKDEITEKTNRMKFIRFALDDQIPITKKSYDECVEICHTLEILPKYLDIRLRDITLDAVSKLDSDISKLTADYGVLEIKTPGSMWKKELHELKQYLQPTKRKRD